ncbi:MAG: endonuclease III [Pseudomonadota bacterium]|nr:endonuclease III [Pseudomonadota bacterium]
MVAKIIARLRQAYPNAACELYYETPYQLLVAVILSAQATDKMVNRCMKKHFQAGLQPTTVLDWGYEGLLQNIRQIGLAPTKAKNIISTTQTLVDNYQGQLPAEREKLEALAGVGRKTANVILGEIFQQPTLAVDTHVFRTTKRLQLHQANTPLQAERELLTVIDRRYLPAAHHLFIAHGRYTCLARKPHCHRCPVQDLCSFFVCGSRDA